jgi:chromosome segregation ATPase
MKAWKLVSLLLAIALIVAVVFCVNLNNGQKLASDEFAKIKGDLDAAQATITEKEKALTDAADKAKADGEAALAEAGTVKDAAVAEVQAKLDAALADSKTALDQAAADKESAVAQAVADGEAKLTEAVDKAKAEMQLLLDEKDKLLSEAQATIDLLTQQLAAVPTPTPAPTPSPTPMPSPTPAATVAG